MDAFRQVSAVLLVFGLLGLVLWALRRAGSASFRSTRIGSLFARRMSGQPKALETLERISLTPQHALHLVRVNGRDLVVATHPQGCTLLTESQTKGASG